MTRCRFCNTGRSDGKPGCMQKDCPGNPDSQDEGEDPELMKAIRDEVIRTNLRWNGLPAAPVPDFGADKVYVSELWMYVRAALRVTRRFDQEKKRREEV